MSKEIDQSLNMKPMEEQSTEIITADESENDFQYARENLYNIIGRGSDAIDDMVSLARASQHPRAYEVLSTLLKTMTEANKDLVELQKKKTELQTSSSPQTINNNLFVGSTAELQKILKGEKDV